MHDQHGWFVFAELVDSLNNQQLKLIKCQMTKDSYDFVTLTVHTHGSNSIKKVIRVLRKITFGFFSDKHSVSCVLSYHDQSDRLICCVKVL
jgi:hypothetical protein